MLTCEANWKAGLANDGNGIPRPTRIHRGHCRWGSDGAALGRLAHMLQFSNGRLSMRSTHTGERINLRYRTAAGYSGDALRAIDWFLRDWRTSESRPFDIRTIEVLSALHTRLNASGPFLLTSGFRSLGTNEMLRRRGIGAAQNSFHLRAQAVDIVLPGTTVDRLAQVARDCGAGGIGCYRRSGFVHLDCGPSRQWAG